MCVTRPQSIKSAFGYDNGLLSVSDEFYVRYRIFISAKMRCKYDFDIILTSTTLCQADIRANMEVIWTLLKSVAEITSSIRCHRCPIPIFAKPR